MKIVVVGGTGLIGSRVVTLLGERGHEAVAASPKTGVDTLTGEGLTDALTGASVVVDVSNSPSFADDAVLEFFRTSTTRLLAAEAAAGVGHHVALSVVGAERLPDSGYLRAKVVQEELIAKSPIPYSIVRATQFFEFVRGIADAATEGGTVRMPSALFQPMAGDEVAREVARVAPEAPSNGRTEIAGPEAYPMDAFFRETLAGWNDPREVVSDPHARYFGTELAERSLLPGEGATLSAVRYREWSGGR
jgi:uncharacterized protein YbjT (DUF2867 family)